jgi:hypothetical protein
VRDLPPYAGAVLAEVEFVGVASTSVVAGLGACLVSASPVGPAQPVVDGVDGVDDQLGEQTPDLVDR